MFHSTFHTVAILIRLVRCFFSVSSFSVTDGCTPTKALEAKKAITIFCLQLPTLSKTSGWNYSDVGEGP